MYEIKKNIPVPADGREVRNHKYPWREMEIGDCIDGDNKMSVAANCFARRNEGYNFTRRKLGENFYRVWRIEVSNET